MTRRDRGDLAVGRVGTDAVEEHPDLGLPPAEVRAQHIGLVRVGDLDASVRFYAAALAPLADDRVDAPLGDLLGVAARDRMMLKRKAERGGAEKMPENPWEDEGSGI